MPMTPGPVPQIDIVSGFKNYAIPKGWRDWFNAIRQRLLASTSVINLIAIDLGQAGVPSTSFSINVPLTGGLYRLSCYIDLSQAASVSSSVQVFVSHTAHGHGFTITNTNAGNNVNTVTQSTTVIRVDPGTTVTYQVNYASSGATPMIYNLRLALESLQP